MAYCGPHGIPLSEFLGWAVSDQQAALSWQAHESRRCSGCGTHPDDWAANRQGAYHAEHYQCLGCAKAHHEAEHPNVKDGKSPGMHVRLKPGPQHTCSWCNG